MNIFPIPSGLYRCSWKDNRFGSADHSVVASLF